MHGAQGVLLGGLLHALVDEVVVVTVAHGIDVVDDGDERCRRGCIGEVGLVDCVAVLGAGGEHQDGQRQHREQGRTAHAVLHRPLYDVLTAIHLIDDGLVLLLKFAVLPPEKPYHHSYHSGKYRHRNRKNQDNSSCSHKLIISN